ncbi:MAG: endonuclease/exonuclease/phosphatase family protein [Alphaproteobacteria bacterium]
MTYNVHRCLGMDGTLSPERIAAVIASRRPDIVALQELDIGRARTGRIDQAHAIARILDMRLHFHSVLNVMEEQYGDAILTALPSRMVHAAMLPGHRRLARIERRGALWAAITVGGATLQVINTHLGLLAMERIAQADALLGPDWLGNPACRGPAVLLGDLNAIPRSRAYRRLVTHLTDAQVAAGSTPRRATFPARLPVLRIDHVLVGRGVRVHRAEVLSTPLARVASDHRPVVVDIEIEPDA